MAATATAGVSMTSFHNSSRALFNQPLHVLKKPVTAVSLPRFVFQQEIAQIMFVTCSTNIEPLCLQLGLTSLTCIYTHMHTFTYVHHTFTYIYINIYI